MYVFTTLVGQLVAPYGITEQKFVVDMGVIVFGIGILGGVLASLVLTCHPEKMVSAAFGIGVAAILTLVYFFVAARHAD